MIYRKFCKFRCFRQQKRLLVLLGAAFWLGLIGLAFFNNTSCSETDEYLYWKAHSTDTYFLEIETKVDMGTISTVQDMLMATGQDGNLYIWDWRDLSKEPKVIELDPKSWLPQWDRSSSLRRNKVFAFLLPTFVIHASHEEQNTILIFREVEGQKEVNRWATGKGWYCKQLRSTRNGRFVAVLLDCDLNHWVEGVSRRGDQRGYRLGLIGPSPTDIQWLPQTFFRNKQNLPILRTVAASEDGNYVCIVGNIDGGWIMLADVVRKKVVWVKTPKREDILYGRWTVAFNDVCFSPDSKRIYVAGNTGLFCIDTVTGKIIKQWPMGRAASVAISPDERLVAGGLPGNGDVYICDVNSANPIGIPVLRLDTGQYSVFGLAFSPDSKLLATEGVITKNIKIWKMPPPALETKTVTEKNE
ncbi:MAG: WD40 repeat domain-containing protein [Planctomycetota bacterium]|jgi:WD40 repeat protein